MRCYSCESKIGRDEGHTGDKGTYYDGKALCETCYFDEPCATVLYGNSEDPRIISYARNETDGDFAVQWHSTDPWRGHYETKSDSYALVNTAELLAYHDSEQMLAKFDKRIRQLFDKNAIEYARVFARSSNVFYQNYDLYVKRDQSLLASLLVEKAKQEVDYRNPSWYKGIVFEEKALNRLSELFPEEKIETDHDAVKMVAKYGDRMFGELQKRIGEQRDNYG